MGTMYNTLLDGQVIAADTPALHVDERGFHYGDGIFETMLLQRGQVRFLDDHWQRLRLGCERLCLPEPDSAVLQTELEKLIAEQQCGVIKLVLSRGRSERGYRPAATVKPTRLWQLFDAPAATQTNGIQVRWCRTRLSRNAQLAGIKHCNRLEQVLAQAEWRDPSITEGLMLDTEDELVCATMSNVFMVLDDVLVTPDLRYSGVQGVMRKQVLRLAMQLGIACEKRAVRAEEIDAAQEVFVTNAVRGIQAVTQLEQHVWPIGPITGQLTDALESHQ